MKYIHNVIDGKQSVEHIWLIVNGVISNASIKIFNGLQGDIILSNCRTAFDFLIKKKDWLFEVDNSKYS